MTRARCWLLAAALGAIVPTPAYPADQARPLDLVLVIDNSGSMQRNDPDFRLRPALGAFIDGLDARTRLGIVIYDQQVRMPLPLGMLDAAARDAAATALAALDYRGQRTDTPAAIERAVYELTRHGRPDALPAVVFITDGIVDTGDPERDRERSAWLREDVAAAAADAGVRIYGVAFTEAADFALIQSLGWRTDGDYFRVADAAGLEASLRQLAATLAAAAAAPPPPPPAEGPAAAQPPAEPAVEPAAPQPSPQPALQPALQPAAPPAAGAASEAPPPGAPQPPRVAAPPPAPPAAMVPWWPWLVAIAVALLALNVMRRRRRPEVAAVAPMPAAAPPPAPKARLIDRDGVSGSEAHELSGRPTMLGRVAGSDTDRLDYVVVDRPTVGRRHALIEYRDLGYWITDQGSVNGTFVNGERITAPVRLRHGDRIRLHTVELEFVLDELEGAEQTVYAQPAQAFTGEATVMVPPDAVGEAVATTVQPSPAGAGEAAGEGLATTVQRAEGAGGVDLDITAEGEPEPTVTLPPEALETTAPTDEAGGGLDLDITGESAPVATEPPAQEPPADDGARRAPSGPAGEMDDAASEQELATWLGDAPAPADDGMAATDGPLLSLDETDLEADEGDEGSGPQADGSALLDDFLDTAAIGGESSSPPPGGDDAPAPAGAEDTTELGFAELVGDLDAPPVDSGVEGQEPADGGGPADDVTLFPDEVEGPAADAAQAPPAEPPQAEPPPGSEDPTRRRE